MPCTKATTEMAEMRLFCCFSPKLGFLIIASIEKNLFVFQLYYFGEKQLRKIQFMAK
jgi:hypothetical protein